MENKNQIHMLSCFLILNAVLFASQHSNAISSSCDGSCPTLDDCDCQLISSNGECNADPDTGSHVCDGGSGEGSKCESSGSLTCDDQTYPTYTCSHPITSATNALLTWNDFTEGGDGGGPLECDEQYHDRSESVVAPSTGWFSGKSRCGQMIRINKSNGRSTTARMVDECDDVVDESDAFWDALGSDKDLGVVDVLGFLLVLLFIL